MNEHKDIRTKILDRYTLLYWIFISLLILAFLKIIYLSTVRREYFKEYSNSLQVRDIVPQRGNIYDCKGRLLATNEKRFSLLWDSQTETLKLNPELIRNNIDSIAKGLAKYLGNYTAEEWKKKLLTAEKRKSRSYRIAYNVDYWTYQKIKKLPVFSLPKYKGGLIAVEINSRKLLHGNLGRRTIGFVSHENKYFGIEAIANSSLYGRKGSFLAMKLTKGAYDTLRMLVEPERGKDVYATIDIRMQDIVDSLLRKQLINTQADAGVAILMEVKTGEIKAVANLSHIGNGRYAEVRNLAATYLYEPGSVMKAASFLSAFEEDPNLSFNYKINTSPGIWVYKGHPFKDYNYNPKTNTGGFGVISLKRIFEVSSNTGTTKLIYKVFKETHKEDDFLNFYSDFYFDKKLDFGFNEEPVPQVEPQAWDGRILQRSIGYGISVTPYHLITFYNAIANGGKMIKPLFVREIKEDGVTVQKFKAEVLRPSIGSKSTLKKMKILLEGVVENGTGKRYVKSNLVKIAGKSGTSQMYHNHVYKHDSVFATFVAYFPADKPKYTCLVLVIKPRLHRSGSSAAGVVVKQIAEELYKFDYDLHTQNFIINDFKDVRSVPFVSNGFTRELTYLLNILNIPVNPIKDKVAKAEKAKDRVVLKPLKIKHNVMPNVVGMGVKEAVYLLENSGLNVVLKGRGVVVEQSIKPGKRIRRGQKVVLTLKI